MDTNHMDEKMKNSEFHQFFVDEIKDIYWAEQHLSKALVKLQKAATSQELAKAFETHHKETDAQIKAVEKIFELLGEEPKAKKCDAMAGILKEAESIIDDTEKDTFTRDAALILAAQKAEHYEIATYGTLKIFARHMQHTEVEKLLEEILDNEKHTDVNLTKIAEGSINTKASKE